MPFSAKSVIGCQIDIQVGRVCENIAIDRLNTLRFFIRQRGEFFFAGAVRERTVILTQEAEEQIDCAPGHVNHAFDAAAELIVAAEEASFKGQVVFDGALDAWRGVMIRQQLRSSMW